MSDADPIGYVLYAFPQLSETFIENELLAAERLGARVRIFSVFRPRPDLEGPTALDETLISYPPSRSARLGHFLRWSMRRPLVSAANLWRGVRCASLTMVKGAVAAGWVASGLEQAGVRHVHAHFAYEPTCVGLPAAKLVGRPFTFTAHALDIYTRTRGLPLRARAADRVITVCEYNVDQILRRCPGLPRTHVEVIYCGVDPDAFPLVTRSPSAEGGFRVVSVGRLVAKKGFDDLLEAVAILVERGLDVRCRIIGEGPLHQELESLVEKRDLVGRFVLAGALPPARVAAELAGADVFVLPCRIDAHGDRDSMPVVLKEAMSTGMPVVSTAAVGIPELVDETVGRLVPPADPPALAGAIQGLMALPATELSSIGREARRRVVEHFDVTKETRRLLQLFEALGSRRRS